MLVVVEWLFFNWFSSNNMLMLNALPRKSYVIPYVFPCNPYGKTYEISLDPVEIIGSGNPYGNPKTSYITYGNP